MERGCLVCLLSDLEDWMSILVGLPSGHELIMLAANTHLLIIEYLTETLTSKKREYLADLLKKLLLGIASSRGQCRELFLQSLSPDVSIL